MDPNIRQHSLLRRPFIRQPPLFLLRTFSFVILPIFFSFLFYLSYHYLPSFTFAEFQSFRPSWNQDSDIHPEIFHSPEAFEVDYAQMEKEFKVFVYWDGDPNTYCHTPRKLSGKYASEGYFFHNIKESQFLTSDPDKAHLFFIPISCNNMIAKGASTRNMSSIVKDYVESLILKYPYWNRTQGADHFFVTCHDSGLRATEGVHLLKKNSIRVACSSRYDSEYIPHKDVALPQIQQPFVIPAGGNDFNERTTLALWAGYYNLRLREVGARLWGNDEDEIVIQNNQIEKKNSVVSFPTKFYKSKFCICPGGSRGNLVQIADSIHYGCVPVIMSGLYDLPFNDILDWKKFSVMLKDDADDVSRLNQFLRDIVSKGLFLQLHKNTVKAQKHFQWNTPPVKYDAFHMVMYELWLRRHVVKYY